MKIKNSIRKKVLTSLLIGATLGTTVTGIGATKSFADCSSHDNVISGEVKYSRTDKALGEQIIKEMQEDSKSKNYSPVKTWHFHQVNDGKCVTLAQHRGYLYMLDVWGQANKGTAYVGGTKLHFSNANGKAQKGWFNVTDDPKGLNGRHYFDPRNYQARIGGLHLIDGQSYLFKQGCVQTGIHRYGQSKYLFKDVTGERLTGFIKDRMGNQRMFEPKRGGAMVEGWYYGDPAGYTYFYPESGVLVLSGIQYLPGDGRHQAGRYLLKCNPRGTVPYTTTGFWSENGDRYYFSENQNGRALTDQWLGTDKRTSNSNGSMYFDKDSHMAKGVTKIGNETYLFLQQSKNDWNHYQTHGWYTDQSTNKRYFFNDGVNARSATNAREVTPLGAAVKGTQIINGQTYHFDQNGVLIK